MVLDTVQVEPNGYFGGLTMRFAWLKGRPVAQQDASDAGASHIPLLTVTVLDRPLNDKREAGRASGR